MKRRTFNVATGFFLGFVIWALTATAHANPASDALVAQGRALLFNNGNLTSSGIVASKPKFKDAVVADPTDQTANFFYALTRMLSFGLEQGGSGDLETLRDLYAAFGITLADDDSIYELPFSDPPMLNGRYDPPQTIPAGEPIRTFLEGPFVDLLDGAIANLDVIDPAITLTLTADETGGDPVEVDYGDVLLFKSLLYTLKASVLIASAYDIAIDTRDVIVLANANVLQIQRDLLDKYQDFLKLQSNGATVLSDAGQALLAGIDMYRNAFNFITNEQDYQGDDLFFFGSDVDVHEAAFVLSQATELQNSLNENRSAAFDIIKEAWVLADADGNRLRLDLKKDANGDFISGEALGIGVTGDISSIWSSGCSFLLCSGWIDEFAVDGSQVTIQAVNSNCSATLTGTLTGGNEIIDGSYTNCDGTPRGSFSGTLVANASETLALDANHLFSNTDPQNPKAPLDIRAVLPEFDPYNETVAGTFPPVDDSSSVLNGLFPDYPTNSDLTDKLNLNPPLSNTSSLSGTVSSSAHTSGNIFIGALQDPADVPTFDFETGTYIGEPGPYIIAGLSQGVVVSAVAWWDADNNGIRSIGDYFDSSSPHEIVSGGTTINLAVATEVMETSLSGQIDCSIFQPGQGNIYIKVFDAPSFTANLLGSASLDEPGPFTVNNLQVGSTVWVYAYWDANGSGSEGPGNGDFVGSYSGNPVTLTAQGTNTNVDINLFGITGVVAIDPGGQPMPNVWVSASGIDNFSWDFTSTDGLGKYVLSGLQPGNFRVYAGGWGNCSISEYYNDTTDWNSAASVEVIGGQTTQNINFGLETGGTIKGAVTRDSDGNPVAGLSVNAQEITTGKASYAQTQEDGSYTICGLPAGSYRIRVSSWGTCYAGEYYGNTYDENSATPVPVAMGQTISGIDISLAIGGKITGIVRRDADAQPIPGIYINAQESQPGVSSSATTGSDGAYTICGLSPGNYITSVSTWGTNYIGEYYNDTTDWALATPVDVILGQTTPNISFSLVTKTGNIVIPLTTSVTGENNNLLGAVVTLLETGQAATWTGGGNYTFYDVPAGSYVLKIEKDGFDTELVNIEIVEGENNISSVELTIGTCGPQGDINDDGKVGLEEAIHALQVISGVE